MSLESAYQFLADASHSQTLRDKFKTVTQPEDFFRICQRLGYDFSAPELQEVVRSHSQGIRVRRNIGVWGWLRSVPWC